MKKMDELYACLYVREFPAQSLLRLRFELHERACVVMEGEAPLERVCSLNTKARRLGVSYGMTRIEVETFPESIILSRSVLTERTAKSILLECAGAFSPRVEDRSEDTAFLCCIDIAGTMGLFGPPELLARNLLQRVRALGASACITVSSNFHAGVCLAKGMSRGMPIRVIAPGHEATTLAPLSLTILDLTEEQGQTFALWGINTLGKLAALPEKQLISRMGQASKQLQQLARGEHPHLFQPVEPPFILEERIELDNPIELLESLLSSVAIMLDQLILRAKARIVALAAVTVTLSLDGGGTHARTVRPAQPSNEKHIWLKLLHLDLEAHPPQAGILSVELHAEPGNTSKVQLGFFSQQLPEAARLDVTLARIRAVVGEECVGHAVLQDTHSLENFHMEPFTISSRDSTVSTSAKSWAVIRQLRPTESSYVTLQNSRPAIFYFRQRRYAVERAYGPWLLSGDWWNRTLWGMEQWDLVARAQDGSLLCCCMVRDPMQNQWQIAGLYD
jgi:protein ImuB